MTALQLEALALRIAEQVEAGHRVEDSFIETKAEWPRDPQKAARRIAAHANEMRGEQIVWVIGVDEDAGTVPGATKEEQGDWFAQVSRFFDQEAPTLSLSRVTYYSGTPIVALLFDTSTYPFVVTKGDKPGAFEREVPMRVGTNTRSAKRSEIVGLFAPDLTPVQIDIKHCTVDADVEEWVPSDSNPGEGFYWWHVHVHAYATVASDRPAILPMGSILLAIDTPKGCHPVEFLSVVQLQPAPNSTTVTKSARDIVIGHGGRFAFLGHGTCAGLPPPKGAPIRLRCSVKPLGASKPHEFSFTMRRSMPSTRREQVKLPTGPGDMADRKPEVVPVRRWSTTYDRDLPV